MTARYRRVPQTEESENGEEMKKIRAERIERITSKIHAIFWVGLAITLISYTDFFNIALNDTRVNRPCLNIAIICFAANICIMIYLTLWLPLVLKVTISWDIYCPRMIPASTILGISCLILLMISFWPVWGLLTPLLIIVFFMGLLFSTHFIPWPC